jgi:hypothetical protein
VLERHCNYEAVWAEQVADDSFEDRNERYLARRALADRLFAEWKSQAGNTMVKLKISPDFEESDSVDE